MSIRRLAYRLSAPVFLTGLLIMTLLCGCRQSLDPALIAADSKMEEHPDSALMMLEKYRLTPNSTSADSAYFALLLTHARYKNFIDETDDSLISRAADWFLDHGDDEKASRALFLQGMIQMNANRLGDAAVSFRKGLDIAHEGQRYMWEGQCARGLVAIYGKIKNNSEQIRYATAEYDAFVNGGYQDWSNFAKLNILRANLNAEKYYSVLRDALDLFKVAEEAKDTMLMEEALVLMGTSKYSIGDFKGALDSYLSAYTLDPYVIKTTHGYNVTVAAANIKGDSLTDEMKSFIDAVGLRKETLPAFKVLASQRRFEEAFNGLERYKNVQDSILKIIIQNNVAESMGQYENIKVLIYQQEKMMERIYWSIGIFILIIAFGISYWVYAKNLSQKELERKNLEMKIEMLKTDLEAQLKHLDQVAKDIQKINKDNERMSSVLRDLLYERYKKINDLCESYYQDRIVESKKKKLAKDIESLLRDFSNNDFLTEVGKYIDLCLEGLYTSFTNDFPNLNEESKHLFMFLTLGLSTRTICVILNLENTVVYNRKSRLKKFIAGSDALRKTEYIENL